jgi:hypothetical protein
MLAIVKDLGDSRFLRIIASIEDPMVIRMILDHLDSKGIHADLLPQFRAPPVIGFSHGV